MKTLHLMVVISLLLFIGCSTTYKLNDFSTKEKFYEDFNKSMYNKSIKVLLVNDSSFIITGNVKISNDSLVSLNSGKNAVNNLALEQIKKISSIYKGNSKYTGLWIGASLGFLFSYVIIDANYQSTNRGYRLSPFPASVGFAAIGGIIGYSIGAIFDMTYIYQFNP